MSSYRITKEELIEHCEKTIDMARVAIELAESVGNTIVITPKRFEEHEIFLRLLKGESVEEIFK